MYNYFKGLSTTNCVKTLLYTLVTYILKKFIQQPILLAKQSILMLSSESFVFHPKIHSNSYDEAL